LQQAASINVPDTSFEMLEYVVTLREGIMDAWSGAFMAMRTGGKSEFKRYVPCAFVTLIVF
jgi:importin subunit beta-1